MKTGEKLYIVKTLAGEYIGVRKSAAFARNDVQKAKEQGFQCIVIETTIDAVHQAAE